MPDERHTANCWDIALPAGGRLTAEHLPGLGHGRTAFTGEVASLGHERKDHYRDYRQALDDAGLSADPRLQVTAVSTGSRGSDGLRTLLDREVPFDAVFGACDLIAMRAVTRPPLATVVQETKYAGEMLVARLVDQINGRSVDTMILPPRLLVRDSCGGDATIDLPRTP